jgi:hypothetical protein
VTDVRATSASTTTTHRDSIALYGEAAGLIEDHANALIETLNQCFAVRAHRANALERISDEEGEFVREHHWLGVGTRGTRGIWSCTHGRRTQKQTNSYRVRVGDLDTFDERPPS